jgi:hypothetical protein
LKDSFKQQGAISSRPIPCSSLQQTMLQKALVARFVLQQIKRADTCAPAINRSCIRLCA